MAISWGYGARVPLSGAMAPGSSWQDVLAAIARSVAAIASTYPPVSPTRQLRAMPVEAQGMIASRMGTGNRIGWLTRERGGRR